MKKRMLHKTYRFVALLIVSILISMTSTSFAQDATKSLQNSDISDQVLLLDNGNTLRFYRNPSDEGIESTLVVEEGHKGSISAIGLAEAKLGEDVTPEEIHHAFALNEVVLETLPDRSAKRKQGWGLTKLKEAKQKQLRDDAAKPEQDLISAGKVAKSHSNDLACSNNYFEDFYSWALRSSSPNWVRLDKTPNNWGGFTDDCYSPAANGQCWGEPRYKMKAQAVTDRWGGAVCGKAIQSTFYPYNHNVCVQGGSCWYQGPALSFEYYWGGWKTMKTSSGNYAVYEFQANERRNYRWKWNTSEATNHRMVVRYAMPNDQFDFMMDWD